MHSSLLLQATPSSANPFQGFLFQMVPFIAIFAIFYLLLIRPARVKQKRHQEMLKSLNNGDRILTTGGIFGTIAGISEGIVQLRVRAPSRPSPARGHDRICRRRASRGCARRRTEVSWRHR